MNVRCSLRALAASVLVLAASAASAQEQPAGSVEQRTFADVTINGVAKGDTLVVLRGSDALIGVEWLKQAGFEQFEGRREPIGDEPFVSLISLGTVVAFQFDERTLSLALTIQPDLLGHTVRDLRQGRPADIVYRRDSSVFLNYAVDVRQNRDYELFTETGLSLRGAFISTTLSADPRRSVVRGLSSATFDDRARLRRWVAGDSFASSGVLGGDALVGGLTVTRDFSVDPYFVRQPTLSLSTPVMTPSTVEVHVNGRLVREEQVAPGRLDIRNLPLTTGHNDTRIVVRDPFGGRSEVNTSFYSTTAALAVGVHEYQYSAGFRREAATRESFNYTEPAVLARHRVGLTSRLTAGGRVEATRHLVSGGGSFNLRLPVGEVEAAVAGSRAPVATGHAASLSYSYAGRAGSLGVVARSTSRHYATLSLAPLDTRAPIELTMFAGAPVAGRVSVSAQHTYASQPETLARQRTELSASSRVSRTGQLLTTVARIADGGRAGYEATAGITFSFGRTSTTTTVSRTPDGVNTAIDLQRSLPVGPGVGYQVRLPDGVSSMPTGTLQFQNAHGRYEVRSTVAGGRPQASVNAAGALVGIGGGVFATRPVRGSFALVQVPGVRNVRGYASNQEIGKTDADGNFFVPDLLPYYGNLLNIADTDVPLDYVLSKVQATIAPPYRGGALVRFPVQRIQRSEGRVLLVVTGVERPATFGQLTVTVDGAAVVSPLGANGEFYFENLAPGRHQARVESADGSCAFTLTVPVVDSLSAKLGALRCVVAATPAEQR